MKRLTVFLLALCPLAAFADIAVNYTLVSTMTNPPGPTASITITACRIPPVGPLICDTYPLNNAVSILGYGTYATAYIPTNDIITSLQVSEVDIFPANGGSPYVYSIPKPKCTVAIGNSSGQPQATLNADVVLTDQGPECGVSN